MISSPEGKIWFSNSCKTIGLEVSEQQLNQLEAFARAILKWNRKINLISRKDEANIWKVHIFQCASVLASLFIRNGSNIIDIGTGGGFPGIPIKILQPDLQLTLLDSIEKKTQAVGEIVSELSLSGITVLRGRAEQVGQNLKQVDHFDYAIARAVAPLKDLVRWSQPILWARQNGDFETREHPSRRSIPPPALIAMKGGDLKEELSQLRGLKGIRSTQTINLPTVDDSPKPNSDKKVVLISF